MIRPEGASPVIPRRADAVAHHTRLRGASISPAAVTAIASAIQKQEGYEPGTLAYTNNNPGNLRFVGQPGASAGAGGYASFATYAAGEAALESQITLDATRGTDVNGNPTTTIAQLISSWAPPSDGNDTTAYIASVASQTGYDPNAPLSSLGSPSDGSAGGGDDSDSGTVDLSALGLGSVPLVAVVGVGLGLALLVLGGRR